MTIVAFVPIKLNNQRFQGKNLKKIGKQTLVEIIFKKLIILKEKRKLDNVYCFCSDERICQYLPSGVIFIKRETFLDGNEIQGHQIYKAFKKVIKSDIYVLCHATSPFVKIEHIEQCINAIDTHDSAFTVTKFQKFGLCNNKCINFNPEKMERTQTLNSIELINSAVFVFTDKLIEQNKRFGDNFKTVEMSEKDSIDIDYEDDYIFACKINQIDNL